MFRFIRNRFAASTNARSASASSVTCVAAWPATASSSARAANLLSESAALVHDNERRWRVFGERVRELRSAADGRETV
jgi:hypothetical protein